MNPVSNDKLQKNQIETQHLNLHPQIVDRLKVLDKIKPKKSEIYCLHHANEPGEVSCAICDHMFCSACIRPFKSMYFCKEHIQLIMRHDWGEVLTIKTSTTDPEEGVRLYEVKKEFFENENLPTYIETHYKINIDQDYIETYLVLYAIKEKVSELKEKLKVFIP